MAAPVRSRRSAGRAVARFAAAVMATTGVLLIADAALTLAWQEPVSALLGAREQDALAGRLGPLPDLERAPPCRTACDHELKRRAGRFAKRLRTGDPVGRLSLPTLDRSAVVTQGTDTASLRKGPGHYPGTGVPGQRGTVAIAGHRTTYGAPFRSIDDLRRGDPIVVQTPYGRFTYRVVRTRIVSPDALWVTRDLGYDRIVLTACHPLYSAAERIVAFARLTREQTAAR